MEEGEKEVRRRHLEEKIREAKRNGAIYTAVAVLGIILCIIAFIPPIIDFTEWGELSPSATLSLFLGIGMFIITMVGAYLSEREKKKRRELEEEMARLE